MQPSDPPYKVLFQDPGLFEEAVRLVAPELADMLDFETATSLDKEHVTALDRVRVQDKLRRVEFKKGRLANGRRRYLLVLLEFQAGHDAHMAWRMRDYLHQVESARRGEDMTAMLDATLARWEEAKVAEGRRRGLAEGVERGLAEGVERGLAEGVERGLAEGVAQGRVALLRRLAALRFGAAVAGQVSAILADVTDVARLDEAGKWLLECDTGEALLRRLRAGREGEGNGVPD